eukprot:1838536-Rhodomonas_salina.1
MQHAYRYPRTQLTANLPSTLMCTDTSCATWFKRELWLLSSVLESTTWWMLLQKVSRDHPGPHIGRTSRERGQSIRLSSSHSASRNPLLWQVLRRDRL